MSMPQATKDVLRALEDAAALIRSLQHDLKLEVVDSGTEADCAGFTRSQLWTIESLIGDATKSATLMDEEY